MIMIIIFFIFQMCAREVVDYQDVQQQKAKSELTEAKFAGAKWELDEVKREIAVIKSELSETNSKLDKATRTLGEKLDAVLANLSQKEIGK